MIMAELAMKKFDPLLFILVIVVGIFSYFAAFRGEVHIWMIPLLVILTAVWYVCTVLVTRGMVRKSRNGEEFFYARGGLVAKDGTELLSGAMAVTKSEIVFYQRMRYLGGVKPVWSAFTAQIESYSLEKVDDKHDGVIFTLNNSDDKVKIASKTLKKNEDDFRKAMGW